MNARARDIRRRIRLYWLAALTVGLPVGRAARAQTVILVRHAEKVLNAGDDPVLTPLGAARADSLAATLAAARLDEIIVTQYQRNRLTALPVARGHHLTPVVVAAEHDATAHARAVAARVRALGAGGTVVVVEHSNTIPAVIAALGGPPIQDLCDTEYSTLFILSLRGHGAPSVVRTRYGAADPAGATDCHHTPAAK
jgi:broad specificity phosphatase PhoE